MLSKLSEEWFKIKIVRDFNKINKPQSNPFGLIQNIQQKNKFFNYSPQYLNFLELVKNTWFKTQIQTKKLGISDLNKMNLEFLEEVSKLDNIEIVNVPTFTYMYVENGNVLSMFCQVGEVRNIDTLNHLKENRSNYTFHIYQISENSARWYKREDKNRLKKVRREKLNELKKVELV